MASAPQDGGSVGAQVRGEVRRTAVVVGVREADGGLDATAACWGLPLTASACQTGEVSAEDDVTHLLRNQSTTWARLCALWAACTAMGAIASAWLSQVPYPSPALLVLGAGSVAVTIGVSATAVWLLAAGRDVAPLIFVAPSRLAAAVCVVVGLVVLTPAWNNMSAVEQLAGTVLVAVPVADALTHGRSVAVIAGLARTLRQLERDAC